MRLDLNLVVLVLEDRAYGMIRWKQEVDGFSNFGLDFGNPDLVADAKSYTAPGAPASARSRNSLRCWKLHSAKAACISLC